MAWRQLSESWKPRCIAFPRVPPLTDRSNGAVVSLRDVTCTVGGRDLLRAVTWEVRRGEHWAVLGPNGSGKTTLLKLVAGYAHPRSGAGALSVLGAEWGRHDWRELRTRIGFASSAIEERFPGGETALDVVLSGFHATLGLYDAPTAAERRRAAKALERVGAARLADAAWMEFSQGERQRVLVARALVHAPELLILDEPCAGLDLVAREDLLAAVGRLGAQAGGPAMLLVTHHAEEVLPVFGRTLLLRAGEVLAAGPTAEMLTGPRLTALFGRKVEVERRAGRCWARPAASRISSGT